MKDEEEYGKEYVKKDRKDNDQRRLYKKIKKRMVKKDGKVIRKRMGMMMKIVMRGIS